MEKYEHLKKKYDITNEKIDDVFYAVIDLLEQEKFTLNEYGVHSNILDFCKNGDIIEILVVDGRYRWYDWRKFSNTYYHISKKAIVKRLNEIEYPEYYI